MAVEPTPAAPVSDAPVRAARAPRPVVPGPVLYKLQSDVPLEAFQWTGAPTLEGAPFWMNQRVHITSGVLNVPVRVGTVAAFAGDWVYLEPDGMLAVMSNALFHATYEPTEQVDEEADGYVPVIPPNEPLVYSGTRVAPDKTNWQSAASLKATADAQAANEAAAKQQASVQAAADKPAAARTA
jgi:hypothetical protein